MKRKEDMNAHLENSQNPETEPSKASLPDATIELTNQVAKLEAEITESNDKYLRLYSEFENYKKRVSRERVDLTRYASSEILLSFLPIIDDLERATKSKTQVNDVDSYVEGLMLIYNKMKSTAEARGLKEMVSIHCPFDPDLHDAIANHKAPSEDLVGKVIEEIEKGYYLHDKVLRHAKVIVGN